MALPNSGPLSMSQISAELAGANDLGYYRGRTYYRGTTPVVISNSPAFSEFYGLALTSGSTPLQLTGFNPPSGTLVDGPFAVLVSNQDVITQGGVAPLSYLWSVVSDNSGGSWNSAVTGPQTSYASGFLPSGTPYQTVLRCTVTDANSVQVSADFTINWLSTA